VKWELNIVKHADKKDTWSVIVMTTDMSKGSFWSIHSLLYSDGGHLYSQNVYHSPSVHAEPK